MTLSIRKTFKNVFSKRYNKTNLLLCALLVLAPQTILILSNQNESGFALILGIVTILVCVLSYLAFIGNTAYAIRNAMFNKKEIFPSIFDSFFQKCLKGVLFLIGDTLATLIMNFVLIIIAVFLIFKMLGGSGFASILIIIAYVVLLIIMLMTNTLISINYTFDLKFGSFFKFKEIFSNLRKHSGTVLLYLIKMLIIGTIVASFIGAIVFIVQVPFYSIKDIPSNLMKNSMLIQQVFYLAFVPFFINLSGQLGAILFAKKIEAIKAKIMQKKNAKMMDAKKEA